VHAARRRFRSAQVGRHGQDGQVQVIRPRGAQRYAGVAAEQLELVGPPLPVEPRADEVQRADRGPGRLAVAQHVADLAQRERQAGQAEVQQGQRPFLGDGRGEGPGTPGGRLGVPVLPEVAIPLEQRQHDPRGTAVQGRVGFIVIRPARLRQAWAAFMRHLQQPVERHPGQRRTVRTCLRHAEQHLTTEGTVMTRGVLVVERPVQASYGQEMANTARSDAHRFQWWG
jgi:hypothetical protein